METIIEMRRLMPLHDTPSIPQPREVRAGMKGKQSVVTIATAFALAAMLSYSSPAAHAEQAEVLAAPAAEQEPEQQPELKKDKDKRDHHGHHGHHKSGMTRPEFEAYRLQKLREAAAYFGIETEGKDAEQLKKELKVAKEANKEKWEAFIAEHKAKQEEYLRKMAESQGIETEGKTAEQLKQELMERHSTKDMKPYLKK